MIHLVIDNHEVEVPEGGTILDAARRAGIDIPTLCFCDGFRPTTSCMLCLVRLKVDGRWVPSCATLAEEGMQVESETEEVHQLRRTGLELLLSDHLGDCMAPCHNVCPTHMDIPLMLRQVAAGDLREAIATRAGLPMQRDRSGGGDLPRETICRGPGSRLRTAL